MYCPHLQLTVTYTLYSQLSPHDTTGLSAQCSVWADDPAHGRVRSVDGQHVSQRWPYAITGVKLTEPMHQVRCAGKAAVVQQIPRAPTV